VVESKGGSVNQEELRMALVCAAISGLSATEGWGSNPAPSIATLAVEIADEALKLLDTKLAPTAGEPPLLKEGK
jgi:hypothetical protein